MTRRKNVIAVMSPKGGVGKTVTTANLATALAMIYDKKILAVDTNVSTASLGLHFDVFYPKHTLNDVSNKSSLRKSIRIYHKNLHLIPASIKVGSKSKNMKKVRENLFNLVQKYEKFLEELSSKYDLVLLDCAPGFDLETLAAMHVAGGVIIVTNPDYPSIVTAVRAIEYAKKIKMPVGGLVLNKIKNKKYELKKPEIEKALGMKIMQEIPYDKRVPESIANKKPVILFKKNSKSSKAFMKLAADISGEAYKGGWLKNILKRKNKI
jgi:septum site-determining protein MinD